MEKRSQRNSIVRYFIRNLESSIQYILTRHIKVFQSRKILLLIGIPVKKASIVMDLLFADLDY